MEIEIKCHKIDPVFKYGRDIHWRTMDTEPLNDKQGLATRTCSYCGSIHPEDLLKAIEAGAKMGGSDWKYGWPHKFYVKGIPNPIAGQEIEVSSVHQGEEKLSSVREPAKDTVRGKFYNVHLEDLNDIDFTKVATVIEWETDIIFNRHPEKGLGYSAPRPGHQRP